MVGCVVVVEVVVVVGSDVVEVVVVVVVVESTVVEVDSDVVVTSDVGEPASLSANPLSPCPHPAISTARAAASTQWRTNRLINFLPTITSASTLPDLQHQSTPGRLEAGALVASDLIDSGRVGSGHAHPSVRSAPSAVAVNIDVIRPASPITNVSRDPVSGALASANENPR